MTTLHFRVIPSGREITVNAPDLVVAGYTGRNEEAVREHIDELAAIGVPPPDSVPAFYTLDARLLTQSPTITVNGTGTSGEVEPVLIRAGGNLYLTVGSDHTDRDLERSSVARSKGACPKPVGATVVEVSAGSFNWDAVHASSSVDGRLYQQGTLASLRVPTDVLDLFDSGERDLVMFGGTLPLIGGEFVPGTEWVMSLTTSDGQRLDLEYRTEFQTS